MFNLGHSSEKSRCDEFVRFKTEQRKPFLGFEFPWGLRKKGRRRAGDAKDKKEISCTCGGNAQLDQGDVL
ncbi:MAG: hypothetical protein RBT36_11895 [Desulfobulbus sp.]|jgi:hypothetical protein|nr:hypothetical protein [Desulfobulbus sp.]